MVGVFKWYPRIWSQQLKFEYNTIMLAISYNLFHNIMYVYAINFISGCVSNYLHNIHQCVFCEGIYFYFNVCILQEEFCLHLKQIIFDFDFVHVLQHCVLRISGHLSKGNALLPPWQRRLCFW